MKWQKKIEEMFWTYPSEKITKLVTTKRMIIDEVIKCKGNNTYKLPHTKHVPKNRA